MSYNKLKNLFEEHSLINDINGILSWDMSTYIPEKSRTQRIKQIKKLYDYKKNIFEQIKKKQLFEKVDFLKLDKSNKLNFELMKNKFQYMQSAKVKNC